ncbi:MAG: hypothetical protein IJW54_07545 [Clostridia bacterium]|nr:hypothetical protein [Clostridia bacterium]
MYSFDRVHYSIRGSYLVWDTKDKTTLKLANIHAHGYDAFNGVLSINYGKGAKFSFVPREISAKFEGGEQNITLFGTDGTYIKGKGKDILVEISNTHAKFDYQIVQNNIVELCDFKNNSSLMFVPIKGSIKIEKSRVAGKIASDFVNVRILPDENGEYEFSIEVNFLNKSSVGSIGMSYDQFADIAEKDYLAWEKKVNPKNKYEKECAYILWCNNLSPAGNFVTDAIVMSKAGMSNVWSWDNAFNALGLADIDYRLAMDQFMIMYKHINRIGRVPDAISQTFKIWNFVKPPVQGWMYKQMMKRNPEFATPHALDEVYFDMKRNTDWWLNLRGDVPSYYHGNDSGQDNSTCFDKSEHIETGELIAFLAVQCAFLSEAAEVLNYPTDKKVYSQLAKELSEKAIKDYWDGEKIFIRLAETGEAYYCNALMPLRVIVLENMLPKEIQEYIVKQIKEHHLCKGGISSEAIDSSMFVEDGYWRGAVWAPDVVMFVYALRNLGYTELADQIAENYKSSICKYGFSENTSAITGKGLRCKGYAWAANAYQVL